MHKLLGVLMSLAALPSLSTAQTQPTLRDLMATPYKAFGASCALFPAAALLDTMELHMASTEPSRFTPACQQVELAEKRLAEKRLVAIARPTVCADSIRAFIEANEVLAYIHTHLPAYKRQYYGFYNSKHQPCLHINFLENPNSSWLYQYIVVMDGGPAFWRISYNLTTQLFYGLSINGEG